MKIFKVLCVLAIVIGMCYFVFGWMDRAAMGTGTMLFLGGLLCFIGARMAE